MRPDYVAALVNRGDIYNYYYAIDRQRAVTPAAVALKSPAASGDRIFGHRVTTSFR